MALSSAPSFVTLRGSVGRNDKQRLDEYLDSVRAVEKRLDVIESRQRIEALDALNEDEVLIEALGEPLIRTHLAVARGQARTAKGLPPEAVAAAAAALY